MADSDLMSLLRSTLPCLLLLATSAQADIYRYVDPGGNVHLSNMRQGPGYQLIVRSKPRQHEPRVQPGQRSRFEPMIDEVARLYGLNQELIHAVIQHESAYDPLAVSTAGAIGLMQLMPATARRLGVKDPRNPDQNVRGGARYLRELLGKFRNLRLALAAYNAGESAVQRHGNRIPPYPETRQYVTRVVQTFKKNLALKKQDS